MLPAWDPIRTPYPVYQLAKALQDAGLPVSIDEHQEIWIIKYPLQVGIMQRPSYCDRGRWQVLGESLDSRRITVDHDDMFPRYYFFQECLVMEIGHWFQLRLNDKRNRMAEAEEAND